MIYQFVSFSKKVSSKGNVYARMVFLDNQQGLDGGVIEKFIYEPLISRFESLGVKFGDLIDVDVDLKGIYDFNLVPDLCNG